MPAIWDSEVPDKYKTNKQPYIYYKGFRAVIFRYLFYFPIITPLRYLAGLFLIYLRSSKTFVFCGKDYQYFYSFRGKTFLHERAVEIPIALEKIRSYEGHRILEVGNVLAQHGSPPHDIVDKYEKAPGVMNEDVVDFTPREPYDLIISISTLEHVGWDEVPMDSDKIPRAFDNLVRCLSAGGELFVTFPLGFSVFMDDAFKNKTIRFTETFYLRRVSRLNEWRQVAWEEVHEACYGAPYPYANGLVVGIYKAA
jgi:hypothetical protein